MKLNLGCGSKCVPGWTNVDYALGARIARFPLFKGLNRRLRLFRFDWDDSIFIHDLRRPLPWPDRSVEIVYSSHTLEHFTKAEGARLIKECWRVLKGGGLIRIVVPDLAYFVGRYQKGEFHADDFVEELGVLFEPRKGVLGRFTAPFIQFPHRCMYDSNALLRLLKETGFEAHLERPFTSRIEQIDAVELISRTANHLIVEGQKIG